MISDPLLTVTMFLLLMTGGVSFLYYERIKRAQKEYEDAKDVVNNVIISFNKQLERQEKKLDKISYKEFSVDEEVIKKLDAHEVQLANLNACMHEAENMLLERIEKVEKKIGEIVEMRKGIIQKIMKLEKIEQRDLSPKIESKAVFPIRKEKALGPLTETELIVLETLANEGEKTAPEIKKRIVLSREHTARLMKKLYENGYLERNTRNLPYTYKIKKEMLKILKK